MKVSNLRQYGDNASFYRFTLVLEGFSIRGFTYDSLSNSIRSAHYPTRDGLLPVVRAYGIRWKQLQVLLKFMLDKQLTMCNDRTMELRLIEQGVDSGRS